jgi:hypothetical protein
VRAGDQEVRELRGSAERCLEREIDGEGLDALVTYGTWELTTEGAASSANAELSGRYVLMGHG